MAAVGLLWASVLLGLPSGVQAQSYLQFDLSPCLETVLDRDALRRRVGLELGPGWRLAEGGDERARAILRIESPCAARAPELTLGLVADGLRLERRVVLGELEGSGALWALAVLVTDLLDRLQQPADEPAPGLEPEPSPEPTPEAGVRPVAELRPGLSPGTRGRPAPGARDPGSVGFARTSVGVAAVSQLYVLVATGMAGLVLHLSHDWLRVSLLGLGTEVPNSLGAIAIGSWRLAVDVVPLGFEHNNLRLQWHIGAIGGVGYAAGRVRNPTLFAAESWLASLSARTSVVGAVAVERDLALELALHAGFDFLGADLRSGARVSATTYGPTISLSFGAIAPL